MTKVVMTVVVVVLGGDGIGQGGGMGMWKEEKRLSSPFILQFLGTKANTQGNPKNDFFLPLLKTL